MYFKRWQCIVIELVRFSSLERFQIDASAIKFPVYFFDNVFQEFRKAKEIHSFLMVVQCQHNYFLSLDQRK